MIDWHDPSALTVASATTAPAQSVSRYSLTVMLLPVETLVPVVVPVVVVVVVVEYPLVEDPKVVVKVEDGKVVV